MTEEGLLDRISINPRVMVGKPVIRGTRLTVEYILELLAHGTAMDEILEEYPGLVKDDSLPSLCFQDPSGRLFHSHRGGSSIETFSI